MRTLILQLFMFVAFAATGSAQAISNPDSALQTFIRQLEGTRLSLSDANQHALHNSTTVLEAEGQLMSAEGKRRREAGAFDPELFFSIYYDDQQQPTASFFSGAPVLSLQTTTATGGLRMQLPTGTSLELSLNSVDAHTNSGFASLNPTYTTFANLTLRQPLLGGFLSSGRKNLAQAESQLDAAQARYDQTVISTTSDVQRLYWDLYAAERDFAVQALTVDRGKAFLEETKTREKAGLVGPNQVATARTFLAEQTLLYLDREEQLDAISDQIASLIGVRPDPGMKRFLAVDPPPGDFPDADLQSLVDSAVQRNLDLQAAQADIEAARALSRAAGWEALPSLDIVGSIGGNGLAGRGQQVVFQGIAFPVPASGTRGDALSQAINRDFRTWSAGVELTVPIGLRPGLGEQERLEAETNIAEQRYIQKRRLLEEQVRASYRELMNGTSRIEAAREGVNAAQEQVRIGLIEFVNGRSTAFELVRLGADYASAQQRYSEAMVRTAKAASTLTQLTSGSYPGATTTQQ
jgi:outer membrane protein